MCVILGGSVYWKLSAAYIEQQSQSWAGWALTLREMPKSSKKNNKTKTKKCRCVINLWN